MERSSLEKTKNGYFRKLSSFIGFFFIVIKTKTDMEYVVVKKNIITEKVFL